MAEFEQIKREREAIQKEKEEKREKSEHSVLNTNPLLSLDGEKNFSLQKRWFEDTVFKNQAKVSTDKKKNYINDAVRSDFHRKFMGKFIQN